MALSVTNRILGGLSRQPDARRLEVSALHAGAKPG